MIHSKLVWRSARWAKLVVPLASLDALILLFSYLIVFFVRTVDSPKDLWKAFDFILFSILVNLISLYIFGGYHRIWPRTSGHDVTIIVGAAGVSSAFLLVIDYFLRPHPVPLSVLSVGNLIAMMGFVAIRYRSRLRSGLRWRWRAIWHQEFPEQETHVLIIGAGDAGQTTAWRMKHRFPGAETRYKIVGFVDDDSTKLGLRVEGSPILGTREDIPRLVEKHNIDLIVFAIHNISGSDFRDILSYCEHTNAQIKLVPNVLALIQNKEVAPLLRDVGPEDLLGRSTVSWHEDVDVSPVSGKTVLVTGAAGSIGSELCRQLFKYGPVKLIMADNNESGLHDLITDLKTKYPHNIMAPVLVDITQKRAMDRIFNKYRPQIVFHSAAYKHVPMLEDYPDESVRVNIGGTLNVAELARDYRVERFVLISTDKAVNPSNVMGASKRICELIMHDLACQEGHCTLYTAVRFGNVLGSRGSVVPTFNRQIEAGGPVTVTHKDMTRYFMSIPEAANLVIHAACLSTGDALFMLRMGEAVKIVELAERMIRLRGLRPDKDIMIQYTGIRPGEKLHEELCMESEQTLPTKHPDIVQLVRHQNGYHSPAFMSGVKALIEKGLEADRPPLEQLLELIALAESSAIH